MQRQRKHREVVILDCALIPGGEIQRERRGNPPYFPASVVEQVAYSTDSRGWPRACLSASRVHFSHTAFESSGEARRSARKRRDGLLRVAHHNHVVDVESGQTRRLEPHAVQQRRLRLLDDHERRRGSLVRNTPISPTQAALCLASNACSPAGAMSARTGRWGGAAGLLR